MPRRHTPPKLSGFLNIDKPPGWTSHDVVAHVRRTTGERRVGHAGTLDPAASGVLPVAVGYATKMVPFLEDEDKTYIAFVRLGVSTDSGDRDGRLLMQGQVPACDDAQILDALDAFRGTIEQTPPMHSAIKIDGRRLYDLAREGITVEVPSRSVTIYEIELIRWESPDAIIRVRCSKGTYIRSIARDLGKRLGSVAMLAHLVRVRAGWFSLSSSLPVADLESQLSTCGWPWIATHPAHAVPGGSAMVLTADEERRWHSGMDISRCRCEGTVCVYDSSKRWVGIGAFRTDRAAVAPKRVIRRSDS